ncbi:cutinase family protein [Streptomyces misionensis]|uniref:cutinase family protein n=1 Tax=Streptomyces misionensis TaxID=67331 RepID=UPI0036C401D0
MGRVRSANRLSQRFRWRSGAVRAAVGAGTALSLATGFGAGPAHATVDRQAPAEHHYYLELGGTGAALPAPRCTYSYQYANQALTADRNNIVVGVCYPASAGPWEAGNGKTPGFGSPSYDDSERQGYRNLLSTAERIHRADPHARYTIVGYSQGAQAADEVLQAIAERRTGIPAARVDGMLYADPRQPRTGLEAVVPRGLSVFGFTSRGPGPADFAGIPVARFCIRTDGVCDATTPLAFPGFLQQHPRYQRPGGIMSLTLAHAGENGTFWYPADS